MSNLGLDMTTFFTMAAKTGRKGTGVAISPRYE